MEKIKARKCFVREKCQIIIRFPFCHEVGLLFFKLLKCLGGSN